MRPYKASWSGTCKVYVNESSSRVRSLSIYRSRPLLAASNNISMSLVGVIKEKFELATGKGPYSIGGIERFLLSDNCLDRWESQAGRIK